MRAVSLANCTTRSDMTPTRTKALRGIVSICRFSFCLFAVFLALVVLAAAQNPAILYTGRTYGYLDWNDTAKPNSLGNGFIATYDSLVTKYPQAILVGTGNNFAPEYGARIDGNQQPISSVLPKGVSNSAWVRTNSAVEFFLQRQYNALVPGQYDFYFGSEFLRQVGTVLPMLGANLFVKTERQTSPQQPLCAPAQLLLPNQVSLPVQSGSSTQGGKGKAGGKSGGASSGKNSSSSTQSSGAQSTQACLQPPPSPEPAGSQGGILLTRPSPDTVYPWSSEFEFSISTTISIGDVSVCRRTPGSNQFSSACSPLISAGVSPRIDRNNPGCHPSEDWPKDWYTDAGRQQWESLQSCKDHPGSGIYRFDIDIQNIPIHQGTLLPPRDSTAMLLPDEDIGLCIQDKRTAVRHCIQLDVQRPLFERAWVELEKAGVKYAIFGVVDPATLGFISNENSSWEASSSFSSKVIMSDPAPSLEQASSTFKRMHNDDAVWTYVLLAEMQPPAAKALATTLAYQKYRFDALISSADGRESTPNLEMTLDSKIPCSPGYPDCTQFVPTPVITPRPIVEDFPRRDDNQLTPVAHNPLQLLEIEQLHDATDEARFRYTNFTEYSASPDLQQIFTGVRRSVFSQACVTGFEPTLTALDNFTRKQLHLDSSPACNDESPFKCLALRTLRDSLDADTAILQRRDFYAGCTYEEDIDRLQRELGNPQRPYSAVVEAVERTFWNSEFLTRVSVSGATLRTILQASDAIAVADRLSTKPPLEPNRELVYVGITKANGTYYIDGAAMDDSKIYSIATSDQLALGDSSYPQFAQIDLVSPDVFRGRAKQTYRLATLVEDSLVRNGKQVLTRQQVIAPAWAPLTRPVSNAGDDTNDANPLKKAGQIESAVQRRNFFTVTLQQAAAGYSFSKPNQSDANIGLNLAGVTNPNVASPHSESVSFNDNFRLLREFTDHVNWGLDEQLTFAKNRQGALQAQKLTTPAGAPIPTDSVSLSANTLILSPFSELQLYRSQPHWKLAFRPGTFSTDISQTRQFLKTATKTEEYELELQRQRNWQPSVGFRYEHDNLNFFEAGYMRQEATNVLSGLTVNGKFYALTAGITPSSVTGTIAPNPGDVALPTYNSFIQNGGYWLGMYTRKLSRSGIVYQGITYGNFFAYGRSAQTATVLTRYAVEFSNGLQIPVWGNLSLSPAFNLFLFQDQSTNSGSSLVRRDLILQLNYLFDWHQGLAWGDTLKGKSN